MAQTVTIQVQWLECQIKQCELEAKRLKLSGLALFFSTEKKKRESLNAMYIELGKLKMLTELMRFTLNSSTD